VSGYDRRQLARARAERLLAEALREVRLARMRHDEDAVGLRCGWAEAPAAEATRILDRAVRRIQRRRGVS